jgi:hypothetical protein
LKDFDISKEAGGVERAIRKNFMGNVAENYLEIHLFWAGKGTCCIPDQGYYGPLISAIHVASGNAYDIIYELMCDVFDMLLCC